MNTHVRTAKSVILVGCLALGLGANALSAQSLPAEITLPDSNPTAVLAGENQRLLQEVAQLKATVASDQKAKALLYVNQQTELNSLRGQLLALESANSRSNDLLTVYRDYGKQLIAVQDELTAYKSKEQAWLTAVNSGNLVSKDTVTDARNDTVLADLERTKLELKTVQERLEASQKETAVLAKTISTPAVPSTALTTEVTELKQKVSAATAERDRVQALLTKEIAASARYASAVTELKTLSESFKKYRASSDKVIAEQETLIQQLKQK